MNQNQNLRFAPPCARDARCPPLGSGVLNPNPIVARRSGPLGAGVVTQSPRVSVECSDRFDAEVLQFLALCVPTQREQDALATTHRDISRCCVGVPGVAGAPRLHGSWATRVVLPGAELDLALPVDATSEHLAVTLSILAARLVWDGRFARVTTDAVARVPWLWAVHAPTDTPVAVRLYHHTRCPPKEDLTTRMYVNTRPVGVHAAAMFLKATLASQPLQDGPSGFALTLLAGYALSNVMDEHLIRHPGLAALTLWTWLAGLPETGFVVLTKSVSVTFPNPDQPLRVVIPDPLDPLTDCAQCGRHFWGSLRRLCRTALLHLATRVRPTGTTSVSLLPGTFLHPAQWLLWQLRSR